MRESKGAALGIIVVGGFSLAMLLVAFHRLSLYIGGEREVCHAVDAGTLNLGKHVFTDAGFKVSIPVEGDRSQFLDVTDKEGEVGLGNINRVWGKVLLAEANADAMQSDGQLGTGRQNADRLFEAAKGISEELAGRLNDESRQYGIFESVAARNSARMAGPSAAVSACRRPADWQVSLMDRGEVTNLEIGGTDVLPSAASHAALKSKDGRIPGYTPISVGRRLFCFVPFKDKEKTHLVSRIDFASHKESVKPLTGVEWGDAVPNAFACAGQTVAQTDYRQEAVACVLSNPQHTYKLSMPHAFVRVTLEENQVTWWMNPAGPAVDGYGVGVERYSGSYANRLDLQSKSGSPFSALSGTLKGISIPLGKEYMAPTPSLDSALFGSPLESGDASKLEEVLVQRANQILSLPGSRFTREDLHRLLKKADSAVWLQADIRDYYMFSPDGSSIDIGPREYALARASWLAATINHEPDGTRKEIMELKSHTPLPPGLVSVLPNPLCNIAVPPFGDLVVAINGKWKPGTGYDGCLGEVRIEHVTDVNMWGIAVPII